MLLEGLEVALVVITFGFDGGNLGLAALGAGVGGAVVVAAGLLLTTFGTLWAVEGLGTFGAADRPPGWPGGDAAIPVLLAPAAGLRRSARCGGS